MTSHVNYLRGKLNDCREEADQKTRNANHFYASGKNSEEPGSCEGNCDETQSFLSPAPDEHTGKKSSEKSS